MSTHNYQPDSSRTPLTNRELARIAIQQHTRRSFCETLELLRLRYSACPDLPVPTCIAIEVDNQAEYDAIRKAFPNGQESRYITGQYRIWRVPVLGMKIDFRFMNLRQDPFESEVTR